MSLYDDTRFMDPSARLYYEGTRNRRRGHRSGLLSTFTFPGASDSSQDISPGPFQAEMCT